MTASQKCAIPNWSACGVKGCFGVMKVLLPWDLTTLFQARTVTPSQAPGQGRSFWVRVRGWATVRVFLFTTRTPNIVSDPKVDLPGRKVLWPSFSLLPANFATACVSNTLQLNIWCMHDTEKERMALGRKQSNGYNAIWELGCQNIVWCLPNIVIVVLGRWLYDPFSLC
jgi:hypothetical protein